MSAKKKGQANRGYISTVKQKFILNEGALSKLKLTPHDINVISVVARNHALNADDLLQLVKESQPSRNAMDIVNIILKVNHGFTSTVGSKDDVDSVKKAIAKNYQVWASDLARSTSTPSDIKPDKRPRAKRSAKAAK